MDPYLEDPAIWPDFDHRWATILSEELNDQLPAPFYARMEMRPELGIVEEPDERARSIVPDVLILRQPHRTQGAGAGGILVVDLLRTGRRVLPSAELAAAIAQLNPQPDYLVLVSRAWRRAGPFLGYNAYPIRLREMLPCVSIPLTRELVEVPLDLQFAFQRTYDGGPYRRGAVDYSQPAQSLASAEDAAWADALLREQGWRPKSC
jgi:hypothetical protein